MVSNDTSTSTPYWFELLRHAGLVGCNTCLLHCCSLHFPTQSYGSWYHWPPLWGSP